MLLSDEEISQISLSAVTVKDATEDARAIESALLAKLGAMELPEPVEEQFQTREEGVWHNFIDEDHRLNTKEDGRWPMRSLFTADQLRQAHAQGYAQGAAAQLAHEPIAYELSATKYANGRELVYTVPDVLASYIKVTPLYTRREAK